MQSLDRIFIAVGFIWLLAGMAFGAWLGASHHNNFSNTHAHINLLGFVLSVLFGLLHANYQDLAQSRLAVLQFAGYQIGVLSLVTGKFLVDQDGTETLFLQVGAVVVILSVAMFLYMFLCPARSRVRA